MTDRDLNALGQKSIHQLYELPPATPTRCRSTPGRRITSIGMSLSRLRRAITTYLREHALAGASIEALAVVGIDAY